MSLANLDKFNFRIVIYTAHNARIRVFKSFNGKPGGLKSMNNIFA